MLIQFDVAFWDDVDYIGLIRDDAADADGTHRADDCLGGGGADVDVAARDSARELARRDGRAPRRAARPFAPRAFVSVTPQCGGVPTLLVEVKAAIIAA